MSTPDIDKMRDQCKAALVIVREEGVSLALAGLLDLILRRLETLEDKVLPQEVPTNPRGRKTPAYGFDASGLPRPPPPLPKRSGPLTAVTEDLRKTLEDAKRTQTIDQDTLEELLKK